MNDLLVKRAKVYGPTCGHWETREIIAELVAALETQLPKWNAPTGWKLVPEELTDDMLLSIRASVNLHNIAPSWEGKTFRLHALWDDVLSITPAAPSQQLPPKS